MCEVRSGISTYCLAKPFVRRCPPQSKQTKENIRPALKGIVIGDVGVFEISPAILFKVHECLAWSPLRMSGALYLVVKALAVGDRCLNKVNLHGHQGLALL